MNLLYLWSAAYPIGEKGNKGYLFSSRYEITFAGPVGPLSIRRKEEAFTGAFWGDHIYDVMAVIGRNGSGKTRLAYAIMETLEEASRLDEDFTNSQQSRFPFLLVFEDGSGGEPEIKIFSSGLDISVNTKLRYYNMCSWRGGLKRFKFAYFTDALSPLDYRQKKYGVVHDGSLGGAIRQTFEYNREMHYINSQRDPVMNYFDSEMEHILEFVCLGNNQAGISFPLPKEITFAPTNYWPNLDYISDKLDHMGISDGKDILREKCIEIQKQYGQNMRSMLAIHMMLNLFKMSCIPQAGEHLEKTAEAFLKKISQTECYSGDAFDVVLWFFEKVKTVGDSDAIRPYEETVRWLKQQPALQGQRNRYEWVLDLKDEYETVKTLYSHYRETNFPYLYLAISFNLSTGEYAFLRRFVRVNEVLHRSDKEQCGGLMLYFDEADQSLHPEWQRRYVDWMLKFISTRFKACSVQLLIATHSPIMLSDIPRDHVLYLRNNGKQIMAEQRKVRTFGSNIHNLFLDAFFLEEGTMGAFAERKINETARLLRGFGGLIPRETQSLVEEIGDDVIRCKLQQMCQVRPPREIMWLKDDTLEETIRLLRGQVEQLEAGIRELERMRHD